MKGSYDTWTKTHLAGKESGSEADVLVLSAEPEGTINATDSPQERIIGIASPIHFRDRDSVGSMGRQTRRVDLW